MDLEYEFRTYMYIGKDYDNWKELDKRFIFNMMRCFRKCISNRKQQRYKYCDTYSEWKEHVKEILPTEINNDNDLLHWLIAKKRGEEIYFEAVKSISIPISVAIVAMPTFFGIDKVIGIAILIIVAIILLWHEMYKVAQKIYFYNEIIEILKNKMQVQR